MWTPIADAAFAAPAVIGRGGLPVEITVTESRRPRGALALAGAQPLVVTARADGAVAGYAEGWCRPPAAHLSALVVAAEQAHLGVDRHLLAAFRSEAAARGCDDLTFAPDVG